MNKKSFPSVSTRIRVPLLSMATVSLLLAGCGTQQTLTAGAKYAEAYSKVGALVNETFTLAEDARLRTQIAETVRLERPAQEYEQAAINLACRQLDDSTAQSLYAAGNLSRYQKTIEGLAKATDKTMAAVVAGLQKSMPTGEKIVLSQADFRKTEQLRLDNCVAFAHAALASEQPFATGATGAEVTAVFELLKAILLAIEAERRAQAYTNLVIKLEVPIRENLFALHAEVQKMLQKAGAEGLVTAAREISRVGGASNPPRFEGSVDVAADALGRFKKAFKIFEVIYLPPDSDKTAFTALAGAHDAIAAAARSGDINGAAAIDDLLALLAFVKDVEEKIAEL